MLLSKHYKTLGIAETATDDEVKTAFRRLASKYHPDKNSSPEATTKFREAREAYEAIVAARASGESANESSRYDYRKNSTRSSDEWEDLRNAYTSFDFDEFFKKTYDYNEKRYYDDKITVVLVPLSILYKGGKVTVSPGISFTVGYHENFDFDRIHTIHGKRIKIRQEPSTLSIVGSDLVANLVVDSLDIMMGTSIRVSHPDGVVYNLKPPHLIHGSTTLKVKGKGMPRDLQKSQFGDMLINITLSTTIQLTPNNAAAILSAYKQKTYTI